jgi:hypothetical protein
VCLTALVGHAQGLVINEVMPGGHGLPDWIELRNTGRQAIDLRGYSLSVQDAHHRLQRSRMVPAGGLVVLYCDDGNNGGDSLIPFRLPRMGGGLLLVAPDGRTIADLFTWPPLPTGHSVGRSPSDIHGWRIQDRPTAGAPNPAKAGYAQILEPPALEFDGTSVTVPHDTHVEVRFTLDGTAPGTDAPLLSERTAVPCDQVLTARAFAHDAMPSTCVSHTRLCGTRGTAVSLRIDPADLYGTAGGLFATGENANYSRSGPAWQRHGELQWHSEGSPASRRVKVGISGSGTRSLAKKSLKVTDEASGEESILRADASPDAFLRNLFMERVAKQGAAVDVQRSTPIPFYINGTYHGLYRHMPAKNTAWLRGLSDAEEIDLIGGPEADVIHGGKARYRAAMDRLLGEAPMDTLLHMIDMRSLMDLACFDLWTGRADQDLNVRCWRPRVRDGKWRWILYDMDLWSLPDDRTVQRMLSAPAPESPFLTALLSARDRRAALLARISAWLATALAPDRATALALELFDEYTDDMHDDRLRWKEELNMKAPEASLAVLKEHIAVRSNVLLDQLEKATGLRTHRIRVEVSPASAGQVFAEDLLLTQDERTITVFEDAPVQLRAEAAEGYRFAGWQGSGTTNKIAFGTGRGKRTMRALFKAVGPSGKDALEQ